jgi:alpha-galactosidase
MLDMSLSNKNFLLRFGLNEFFLEYYINSTGTCVRISPPVFEIDGKLQTIKISHWEEPIHIEKFKNGVSEYFVRGTSSDIGIIMELFVRISLDSPIIRFRYSIFSQKSGRLTKKDGKDNISYFSTELSRQYNLKEIRLSEFNEMIHSNHLTESIIHPDTLSNSGSFMGPIFTSCSRNHSFLIAYEHGSQFPDRFLEFNIGPDYSEQPENASILSLRAVRSNYQHNTDISGNEPFESIWFEIGAVEGDEDLLASEYRNFILKSICITGQSRKPYIFYNTWGRQEKIKWAGEKYLTTMNLDYTLAEIDIAHKLGIEVYVIDTGWYLKTGDWEVNRDLFPDKLKEVKRKLDGYGMKLGLWFNPTAAALTSEMLKRNNKFRVTKNSKPDEPCEIWETEKSVGLCFVSPYWEDFANRLIELVHETGVSYFKWDAIWQYGCNAPGHFHGDENDSEQERKDRYAYLLPIYMAKVIEKVSKVSPEAIFDFDITEEGRCVGLQFLAQGKYFAINNGPYYHNFDVCEEWKSPTTDGNPNIFVNTGPARGWYTRSVLDYDKWIPSVLFLTHYFPYEPASSQMQNLGSLMLGQNGIWGEITGLSEDSLTLIRTQLELYKQVRNDITESTIFVSGRPGDSCEIYEKINKVNGRGIIVLFTNTKGEYEFISSCVTDRRVYSPECVSVMFNPSGRAVIKVKAGLKQAMILYFGVNSKGYK